MGVLTKLRDEWRSAEHPPPGVVRLRHYSYLAFVFERIFFWLEFLSLSILFIPTRNLLHSHLSGLRRDAKETYMVERIRNRARHVDLYIISWIAAQALLAGVVLFYPEPWVLRVVQVIVILRIVDIAQANANMNVFDRIRYGESSHVTVSVVRNLIIAGITYMELILSFGLLYLTFPGDLRGLLHRSDVWYFSMVTQLTIGYGDILPHGEARYVAMLQGFVGFFFNLLIMGRFVSILPSPRSVFGDEGRTSRDA